MEYTPGCAGIRVIDARAMVEASSKVTRGHPQWWAIPRAGRRVKRNVFGRVRPFRDRPNSDPDAKGQKGAQKSEKILVLEAHIQRFSR